MSASPTAPRTARDFVRASTTFLTQRGVPAARRDAELLLAEVLHLSRTQLYMDLDRPMIPAEVDAYRELVRRRAAREPVAYIVGTKGFWKLDFKVDRRVLIPRPETERLVELVLAAVAADRERAWRIVDVGTGSGCLAISLAHELPAATVVAIDSSPAALEVASANAEQLGVRDRVRLVQGDLLQPLLARGSRVDIVVSNPPYVGTGEGDRMDPDVRLWEPGAALYAGDDGLDVVRRLLPEARAVLAPGGRLWMEHGDLQGPACRELAREAGFAQTATLQDYNRLDRVLYAAADAEDAVVAVDAPAT
jgi:release factor glutamine methyltransferase